MKKTVWLPKEVLVLGRIYQVEMIDGACERTMGTCSQVHAIITIHPNVCETEEMIVKTFFHEWGHAWAWESGLRSCPNITRDMEEMIVETLANSLFVLCGGQVPSVDNKRRKRAR